MGRHCLKTVSAYRLVKEKYALRAFKGEGAKRHGGRWNGRGKACVYTADSESLAILEVAVNTEKEAMREPFCLFELCLPERDVHYLKPEKLPKNWREIPSPQETQHLGDKWLEEGKTLALAVPSAVAPRDRIYILNPEHKKFSSLVKEAKRLSFEFDGRLETF